MNTDNKARLIEVVKRTYTKAEIERLIPEFAHFKGVHGRPESMDRRLIALLETREALEAANRRIEAAGLLSQPSQQSGGVDEIAELKSAGLEALREIGRLKVDRKALIDGGNRLLNERNEAIQIANNILYEFEARDQQHDSTVVDSYTFLVGRDWEPFLERIKWEESDAHLAAQQPVAHIGVELHKLERFDVIGKLDSTAVLTTVHPNGRMVLFSDLEKLLALPQAEKGEPEHCPNCPDRGWYIIGSQDDPQQEQCQFCYENQNSVFNRTREEPQDAGKVKP